MGCGARRRGVDDPRTDRDVGIAEHRLARGEHRGRARRHAPEAVLVDLALVVVVQVLAVQDRGERRGACEESQQQTRGENPGTHGANQRVPAGLVKLSVMRTDR